MNGTDPWPAAWAKAKELLLEPAGLGCPDPVAEPEGADYGACVFTVGGRLARFRVAKTTPTKVGQFVTLWQRTSQGPIRPFDTADGIDLFVVHVTDGTQSGQFVFPADVLARRGVLSVAGRGGKRAIRLYAPWVETSSAQAAKTQAWQIMYFLPFFPAPEVDRIRGLYGA